MSNFSVFSNVICPSGSEYSLMTSGMSKFARRKNAEMAFWCSIDLYLTGFQSVNSESEKRTRENYRSRFINRFPVALLEDNMPKCWWVLKHLKKFTDLCMKSYANNQIDMEVMKIMHFLIFNIAKQEKCRMLQHLRELDDDFKSIENAKPSKQEKVFLNILKNYSNYDKDSIDSCISVYKIRKKPIILSAALAYVKYGKLFQDPRKLRYKKEFYENLKLYTNNPTPNWKSYPFLFDKHVGSSVALKYGVSQIKGWKGFLENEEQTCWDNAPLYYKNNPVCVDLKKRYWNQKMCS